MSEEPLNNLAPNHCKTTNIQPPGSAPKDALQSIQTLVQQPGG